MERRLFFLTLFVLVIMVSVAVAGEPDILKLWVPGNDWSLNIDIQGLVIGQQQINDTYNGRFLYAESPSGELLLTVYLDPAFQNLTVAQYRDSNLVDFKQAPIKLERLETSETDRVAYISYYVTEYQGRTGFEQRNEYAYLIEDSTWINVHVSCMNPDTDMNTGVDNIINSLAIESNYTPTAFDFFIYGSWAYNKDDLKRAAEFYEQGLTLEKEEQTLPQPYWLVLVDNLGMSYGITGDRANARRVFEYGISVAPDYPMFHYNLACAYAEDKVLDSALAELGKAYENKANMIEGEEMPDPFQDESFRRYWNNQEFNKFMKSINKGD